MSSFAETGSRAGYYFVDILNPSLGLNWTKLFIDFGVILGLILTSAILTTIAQLIAIKISGKYAYVLRNKVRDKIDALPLSYFDKHPYGELLSVGTNDVDAIAQSLNQVVVTIVSSITMFIGVLIAMFVVNWRLALVALTTLPLSVLVTIIVTKNSQKQFVTLQKKTGKLEGIVEENFAGLQVVQLFNQQAKQFDLFKETNDSMASSNFWSQWLSSFIFPSMRFISNLGFVGVLIVAGVTNDIISLAPFLIFLNNFSQPFFNIGQISNTIQTTLAGAERVFGLLGEKEEQKDSPVAVNTNDNIQGEFNFSGVDFSYSPDKELIKNMNLHVEPGDTIAIVGPTGAGKTTLVNLIMRFYEISAGSITLDGIDIRDYSRSALRRSVGMVLQDTWLFNGSIKNNIRYGNRDASDEEVIAAAKAAKAHHFITTLPGEYDFILNEDGTNISQGQRQLITIARAIISKPKILILDEATSSVDTRTEFAIQTVMDEIMQNRTTFIIAHRLSTIRNAKKILVMNKGHIIEMGNHHELLAKDGFYASLYNAQFLGIDNSVDVTD
jgi:ATP-binding cassette subfamily B protein